MYGFDDVLFVGRLGRVGLGRLFGMRIVWGSLLIYFLVYIDWLFRLIYRLFLYS